MTARLGLGHDVVGFARALRAAGLPVGVSEAESFAQALAWIDPLDRRAVYLAARATLVRRREDIAVFDELFAVFFGGPSPGRGQPAPVAPRHDPHWVVRTALVSYMAERVEAGAREVDVPEHDKAASPHEQLQRKDFAECTPAELEAIARAMRELRLDLTLRRTRRLIRARRHGRLDLPRIVRDAARRGGAVLALARRRPKLRRRPLVVLADISGSMELYARILLQFLHGVTQRHARTETFVFGTRLTRITGQLQIRRVDAALAHAAREIVDFAGGTRIGECLHAFDRLHARRVLGRGAVVLIISDGWDTGDPARLAAEMRRLAHRAHRVVWLNPLLGRAGYAPEVRGMAAALAHVDDFLPVHDLHSLHELAGQLARIPRRKGAVHPGRSGVPVPSGLAAVGPRAVSYPRAPSLSGRRGHS
ncbi:MAG TPA: VWA domain-containing protein [Kofleriaceae bacterium]|nr:VWA domain-containing protein [Kofleriaceae bacterium]